MDQGHAGNHRGGTHRGAAAALRAELVADGGAALALPLAPRKSKVRDGAFWKGIPALDPAEDEESQPLRCQCCAGKRARLALYPAGIYEMGPHGSYRVARLPFWLCKACIEAWREVDAVYSLPITWRKRRRGEVAYIGQTPAA